VERDVEGVRTTGELLSAGFSAGRIRRMVRDGTLCSLRPGVYASPATVAALVRDARLRAADYEVVHFSWPEITRAPAQVVDSIRLAFRRSAAG
jgi:hypothetical protein